MNSEDKFKESLNNLISQKEIPFDEKGWEQARHLIDDSRAYKGGIKPSAYIISGISLLITAVFCFYFFNRPETVSDKKLTSNIDTPEQITSVNPDSDNTQDEKNTYVTNSTNREEKQIEVKTSEPISNTEEVKTTSANNITDKIISEPNEVSEKTASPAQQSKKQNKTIVEPAVKAVIEAEITSNQTSQPVEKSIVPTQTKEEDKVTEEVTKKEEEDKITLSATTSKENKTEKKSEPANEKETLKNEPEVVLENNNTFFKNESANKEKENAEPQINTTINVPAIDSIAKVTSGDQAPDTTGLAASLTKTLKTHKHILSVEAGFNYLSGWRNPGKKDANGFNPILGVIYSSFITEKIITSIGINYYSTGNISYSSVTAKTTRYKLGEESEYTIITPTKLHYVSLPIKLNYMINKNHSVGIGCNIGYLINIDAQTETYTKRLNQTTDYVKSKASGYTQGFNAYDTQLSLVYRRRIYKELFVNTEVVYGLTDIKNNAFFNYNLFERNVGVKCSLIFNVFKK